MSSITARHGETAGGVDVGVTRETAEGDRAGATRRGRWTAGRGDAASTAGGGEVT